MIICVVIMMMMMMMPSCGEDYGELCGGDDDEGDHNHLSPGSCSLRR